MMRDERGLSWHNIANSKGDKTGIMDYPFLLSPLTPINYLNNLPLYSHYQ